MRTMSPPSSGEVATTACRRPPGGEGVASGSAGTVAVGATLRAVAAAGGVAETRRGEALGRTNHWTNASQLQDRQRTAATATTSGRLRRTIDVVAVPLSALCTPGLGGLDPPQAEPLSTKFQAEQREERVHGDDEAPTRLLEAPAETGHDRNAEERHRARCRGKYMENNNNSMTTNDPVRNDIDVCAEEQTCGICLEAPKDPLDLPCGHSFCDGCINEWRSRYGVEEETRRKCPICRARIPPSREMVTSLFAYRTAKQKLEDNNGTSSKDYQVICHLLKNAKAEVGADWDGVTVLEDNNVKQTVVMPDYITMAIGKGDIKSVLRWINANQAQDRANAITSAKMTSMPVLCVAAKLDQLALMTILLQLGADVDSRDCAGYTAIQAYCTRLERAKGGVSDRIRLLLSWGASFFPGDAYSRKFCICVARKCGRPEIANLLESELGGRRCEIFNLSSQPDLNGKTCIADKYLPDSNQYKVTLETKSKEVLVLSPGNLKRRDRTPQDCGYYIEFKNGRTIRHDFDSSEDCRAFVTALNDGKTEPAVAKEAEARAERAAADLLAELGLNDSPDEPGGDQAKKSKKKTKMGLENAPGGCLAKKSKKKKGGKKKKKTRQ
ncbi:hypothetical protein THAOC_11783 [Thalassiosira oceanica]|uniref:RING-type domain-containing protein n=1 Tax=Thalassiosira oceanica TaxID=159749 RepID=K0T1W6_THAOC|nr:hypothetical protein THAOC_11783 [Thalassiosira oceanica]|eukprot:EJK67216.1 hypothetical protein THAOC_11783 [Thalassiosira oceanica]